MKLNKCFQIKRLIEVKLQKLLTYFKKILNPYSVYIFSMYNIQIIYTILLVKNKKVAGKVEILLFY